MRATLDSLSAHIAIVDASGEILLTNEAWRRFARANGTSPREVSEGANYLEVCDAAAGAGLEEARTFGEGLRSVLDGRSSEFAVEYPCPSPTEERWFVARATRFLAGTVGKAAVVVHEDVTERKLAEEAIAHQALHDPLTDLPNRRLLQDRLEHALSRAERDGSTVAVFYLDLEGFKAVNDEFGHEAGDRLLVAVAERIKNLLRYEDTLARFGGDEFAVLLERVENPSEALRVAHRIAESLREPFGVSDYRVSVNTSIGIALGDANTDDPEAMLREADTAMYRAKEQGPGRYEVFDPAMQARAQHRLEMEAELRRAVEQEEFVLHYQPMVSLRDGGMVGFEALLRWQHPKKGLLLPSAFLPLAEETDQIVPIDGWVLQEVCRQAKRWEGDHPSDSPTKMNVNLSARQLKGGGLARTIERTLTRVALEIHTLGLDITEGFLLEASVDNARTLDDLKKMGIRLDLDDFGTGYSSLSYLKDFPVHGVKLDKSFVEGLGEDATGPALVRKIIDLCHTLGLEVLAEGIETPEQAALLKEMGCDLGQGYYFAHPLPSEEFAELPPKAILP